MSDHSIDLGLLLAAAVASVTGVAGAVFVFVQLRQLSQSTKSASIGQIHQRMQEFNSFLIDHDDLLGHLKVQGRLPEREREKAGIAIDQVLSLYLEAYWAKHKYGVMDDQQWESWDQTIRQSLNDWPRFVTHWRDNKENWPRRGFREYMDRVIREEQEKSRGNSKLTKVVVSILGVSMTVALLGAVRSAVSRN